MIANSSTICQHWFGIMKSCETGCFKPHKLSSTTNLWQKVNWSLVLVAFVFCCCFSIRCFIQSSSRQSERMDPVWELKPKHMHTFKSDMYVNWGSSYLNELFFFKQRIYFSKSKRDSVRKVYFSYWKRIKKKKWNSTQSLKLCNNTLNIEKSPDKLNVVEMRFSN